MSEYMEIETETTDDPNVMRFLTNLTLCVEGKENYDSVEAMEEGSALAQALAFVEGITALELDGQDMLVTSDGDMPWHIIISEISAIVKDFFL